jgi:hypothetical protein
VRAPEWQGWLVLCSLIVAFAVLTWWIYFSPLRTRPSNVERPVKLRKVIAALMFGSATTFMVGVTWDELWHRQYGGFGDDFLWPPHLLLYASLGLNGLFAIGGLLIALRGKGGLRERFRAEPLLGTLGLIAAYQMASIPSDELWHRIIGPDMTAWSLPHILLALTTCGTWLVGVAIARWTVQRRHTWRFLSADPMDLVSIAFISMSTLILLVLGVTEWEWLSNADQVAHVLDRPAWSYPVVVLLIGIAAAHLALHATRRFGAATATALTCLAIHLITMAVNSAYLPDSGQVLGSHLLLVPPAIIVDLWYAMRSDRDLLATRVMGSALYAAVFLVVGLPYAQQVVGVPGLVAGAIPASIGISLLVAIVAGHMFADIGSWVTPSRARA